MCSLVKLPRLSSWTLLPSSTEPWPPALSIPSASEACVGLESHPVGVPCCSVSWYIPFPVWMHSLLLYVNPDTVQQRTLVRV